MALAICFRYDTREYYAEINPGEELSFGCHKSK